MKYLILLLLSFIGANANAQDFLPILVEGRVWNCEYNIIDGYEIRDLTIEIKGDTVVGEHNCKKAIVSSTNYYGNPYSIVEPCFEENGRLYCFDPEDLDGDMGSRENYTVPCLICDFNLGVGDDAWFGTVHKVDTIEVHGVQRRRIFLDDEDYDIWVEGIGPSTDLWPSMRPRATDGHVIYLKSCYDENGNLIFSQEDFLAPATNGIDGVEATSAKDGAIYDLTGKAIQTPKRNEIYIKDGRKRIQR